MQQRLREAFIDLGAQPRNVDVNHIRLRIEMVVPDVLQKHGAGDDLARMPHQIFEQAEFARLQLELLPGAADLVRKAIELEIADAIDGLLAAIAAPARQRLDTRQQLRKCVRLCQIIVTAGAQALDAVVDLAERGEDEHRRFDGLTAQGADDGKPIALRQHAIDDQHVVLTVERKRQAFLAIGGLVGDMADLAERLDEIIGRVAIIFNNEKAHGVMPWLGSRMTGSPHRSILFTSRVRQYRPSMLAAAPALPSTPWIGHLPARSASRNIAWSGRGIGRGWRAAARHPRYRLHPGGGDICREAELVIGGDGPYGPSPGNARQRGRRMPADRPITQALPSGRATNFVPSPDFTRNNTACLPSLRASLRLLRTSEGVATILPPTSRMTSPTWKPCSAATPPSATAVTTTPSPFEP